MGEYTFGVHRGKWRNFFRPKVLSTLREWRVSPQVGAQKGREKLQKLALCRFALSWFIKNVFFPGTCHN